MKGLCVSKGSVRGKAIIVDSVFATKTIAPGTILVMKTLDRKLLVSLSKNVVGVIAESGNIAYFWGRFRRDAGVVELARLESE